MIGTVPAAWEGAVTVSEVGLAAVIVAGSEPNFTEAPERFVPASTTLAVVAEAVPWFGVAVVRVGGLP